AGLTLIGLFRDGFGLEHLFVDHLQFLGAFLDPLFQVNVGLFQRLFGSAHGGDVLEGGHIATTGYRAAVDFQHGPVWPVTLIGHGFAVTHAAATVGNDLVDFPRRQVRAGQVVAHQVFD